MIGGMEESPVDPHREGTEFLALRAQAGDGDRFALLYERVAPAIFAWARLRMTPELRGVLSPEDVVQEVWMRALEGFASFDGAAGSFRHWAFGIARHVLYRQLRKVSRRRVRAGYRSGAFDLDAVPEEATAVSLRLRRDEGLQRFLQGLEGLSEEDRELLLLRGLEGLAHEEVAAQLGLQPATVRQRWNRLRRKLEALALPDDLIVSD